MKTNFALYGAALLLVQALAACGSSPVAAPKDETAQTAPAGTEARQYDKLVVVFGDSLYAGYRLAPTEGLAPQLQGALQKAGIDARVHNAGVSGDTTAAANCG